MINSVSLGGPFFPEMSLLLDAWVESEHTLDIELSTIADGSAD